MPKYIVTMVVDADTPAGAILAFLYPDGEPTEAKIKSIAVEEDL